MKRKKQTFLLKPIIKNGGRGIKENLFGQDVYYSLFLQKTPRAYERFTVFFLHGLY